MSEKDKAQIMEALNGLPEDKKQFVLGYAAGVVAKTNSKEEATTEKTEPEKEVE